MNNPYLQVKEFHEAFNHPHNDKPTVMDKETALKRANWKLEEIVELLFATVGGDKQEFIALTDELQKGLDSAINKELTENKQINDILTAQADALIDISYFNYGSFTILGIEPQPLFDIVQDANMGKLWNIDGKMVPRYREEDGKIMKPPHWEEKFAPEPKLKEEIQRQLNNQ